MATLLLLLVLLLVLLLLLQWVDTAALLHTGAVC
jgi:hypothetical protein